MLPIAVAVFVAPVPSTALLAGLVWMARSGRG
jgi:hypothetical protein